MEYINGTSLHELVNEQGKLHENIALHYIKQVANALLYIHQNNINHLDLKPANILLDLQGNTTIIDFGLAKHYDYTGTQTSNTPTGFSTGYTPIEQITQNLQQFNPTADIYALGATLFFLITAQNPPDATTLVSNTLPQLPNNISEKTKNAVKQAMQPDKNKRPQNVEEFLKLLPDDDTDAKETTKLIDIGKEDKNKCVLNDQYKAKRYQKDETKLIEPTRINMSPKAVPTPPQKDTNKQGEREKTMRTVLVGLIAIGVLVAGGGITIIFGAAVGMAAMLCLMVMIGVGRAIIYLQSEPDPAPIARKDKMGKTTKTALMGIIAIGVVVAGIALVLIGNQNNKPASMTENYKQQGDNYNNLEQYDQAIACYQKYIADNPNDTIVYSHIGNAYYKLKQYDQAINCFQKYITINPNDANGYYNMGNTYYNLKKYERAINCFQKAIDINPNHADAHYNVGKVYLDLEKYNQAISWYQKTISIDPNHVKAHKHLGLAYHLLEKYSDAISWYQKAIDLDPNDAIVLYNTGCAYDALRSHEQAIIWYQHAARLGYEKAQAVLQKDNKASASPKNTQPTGEESYKKKGDEFFKSGDYEQAIKCYQKAIDFNPKDADVCTRIGNIIMIKKSSSRDRATALVWYQRAIDIDPNHVEAYMGMGHAYDALGYSYNLTIIATHGITKSAAQEEARKEYDKARMCYQKVIDIEPAHKRAYECLGEVYRKLGDFDQFIICYQKAIDINPEKTGDYYFKMGSGAQILQKNNQAIFYYQKAIDNDPIGINKDIYYYSMGEIYTLIGDHKQAINCYQKAAQLGSKDAKCALEDQGISW
jgi:tetratricopeptide (TPR) repeat protein